LSVIWKFGGHEVLLKTIKYDEANTMIIIRIDHPYVEMNSKAACVLFVINFNNACLFK
jgi:hypothetical protein